MDFLELNERANEICNNAARTKTPEFASTIDMLCYLSIATAIAKEMKTKENCWEVMHKAARAVSFQLLKPYSKTDREELLSLCKTVLGGK